MKKEREEKEREREKTGTISRSLRGRAGQESLPPTSARCGRRSLAPRQGTLEATTVTKKEEKKEKKRWNLFLSTGV